MQQTLIGLAVSLNIGLGFRAYHAQKESLQSIWTATSLMIKYKDCCIMYVTKVTIPCLRHTQLHVAFSQAQAAASGFSHIRLQLQPAISCTTLC